jgi:hypothetical protein
MITITRIIKSMGRSIDSMAKARVNSALLSMGREWVEDKGYSYEALRAGVSKWPWRRSPEKVAEEKQIKRAIRELKSYNDRELRDIGISRSKIEQAVRYGNAANDSDFDKHAA